ncbi:MAG: hypothetical protein WCS73_01210 [Lentisphaeria bacterium]
MNSVIALDIGGVCIKLHFENILQRLGLVQFPEELMKTEGLYESGQIEWPEWCNRCRKILSLQQSEYDDEKLRKIFVSNLGCEMPGMADQCKIWKKEGRQIVLFSNIAGIHVEIVEKNISFWNCIDDKIFSFEVKAIKPGQKIYQIFEEKFGVPDLYLDDRMDNIEGGRKRGWNSHLFTDADELEKNKNKLFRK